MPHLTLEYSANVSPRGELKPLFARLHRVLADVGGIPIGNCKSRARRCETFLVADGGPAAAFVHLDLRFLEGRAPEVKRAVGEGALAALQEFFPASVDDVDVQVTVEIRDIVRASYFKVPKGSL